MLRSGAIRRIRSDGSGYHSGHLPGGRLESLESSGTAGADDELIADYVDGAPGAFRTVDGWIRAELADRFPVLRGDIEDLGQTVHQKLLVILREERFERRSSLRTFASRVARYTAVDLVRRLHRDRLYRESEAGGAPRPGAGPYGALLKLEQGQLLRQILLLAPAACRKLWQLAYVDRLSYTEIGRRLAIPGGTVKSRMWYCRRKALALLEEIRGRSPAGPEPAEG